jgi:hypothetical protein
MSPEARCVLSRKTGKISCSATSSVCFDAVNRQCPDGSDNYLVGKGRSICALQKPDSGSSGGGGGSWSPSSEKGSKGY